MFIKTYDVFPKIWEIQRRTTSQPPYKDGYAKVAFKILV